jgi:DNA repair exonuclease SbcCD ATPase subunit
MKKVILKKLKLKNFLSIGNDWVELDIKPGLTFITGYNYDKNDPNGVGKSALFTDSFFFSLYGHTLRKLNKKEIGNNITKGVCKTVISFDVIENAHKDEYALMRQLAPAKMQLIKNGEDITQNIRETDDVIEKIISASSDVFKYAVVMTLNDSVGFMSQNRNDRRKFVESILRLGVFADMSKLHSKLVTESRKDYEVASGRLSDAKRNLLQYEEQTRKQTERREEKLKELRNRLQSNAGEIERLDLILKNIIIPDVNKIQENKKLIETKQKELYDAKDTILTNATKIKIEIQQAQARINHIKSHGPSCVTCERPFTDDDKKQDNEEITTLIDSIKSLNEKQTKWGIAKSEVEDRILKCNKAINEYNEKIRFADGKMNEKKSITSRVNQLKEWNETIQADLNHVSVDDENFVELINSVCNNINDLQKQVDTETDKIETLEIVKFLLSEEGIKKFIVKKILKLLNSRLLHYLKKLNAPCTCSFNDLFEESIVNDKDIECSYESFSGGERKRIDLAMLFTFQDLRRLQSDTSINVSVYDELIDSALSNEGVQCVLAMLKERSQKYNEAMYIITHRKENASVINDANLIFLEKKDGITYVKATESATM